MFKGFETRDDVERVRCRNGNVRQTAFDEFQVGLSISFRGVLDRLVIDIDAGNEGSAASKYFGAVALTGCEVKSSLAINEIRRPHVAVKMFVGDSSFFGPRHKALAGPIQHPKPRPHLTTALVVSSTY